MQNEPYHPEKYWTEVGQRIEKRLDGRNVIAGDDEPYYRYKRSKFLQQLNLIKFNERSVLEVGAGPGGNLIEIWKHKPNRLCGVDISEQMVKLARRNTPKAIEIIKINGTVLPFKNNEFDIVLTSTVLQHNTDEKMLKLLMNEIARVSRRQIFLFERIEKTIKGDDLCLGRPVNYYTSILLENDFSLKCTEFLNIRTSYYISGAIRKLFNSRGRKEGESLSQISYFLQRVTLPITKIADRLFLSKRDVAMMKFEKIIPRMKTDNTVRSHHPA